MKWETLSIEMLPPEQEAISFIKTCESLISTILNNCDCEILRDEKRRLTDIKDEFFSIRERIFYKVEKEKKRKENFVKGLKTMQDWELDKMSFAKVEYQDLLEKVREMKKSK